MAVSPEWVLRSPGEIQDTDGSNPIALICATGAPDGSDDPMKSAGVGSLYFRPSQADDTTPLYVKVDLDNADEDWVQVLIDKDLATHTIASAWTLFEGSGKLYLRDSGQSIYSPAANVGALALGASADVWKFGDVAGLNYLQLDYAGELTLVGTARLNQRAAFELFDDFLYRVIDETTTSWILNKGSDGAAADPAVDIQERGAIVLTTGTGDGTTAADGSQIICAIPVQADSGGLVVEARLHINTAITNVAVNFGLTDVTTLEEPFSNAADVITSNATDAACFVYDSDATTKTWWMCAVDSDADDSGDATSGTAPVADTYQTLRIEVSANGNSIKFYIDGTLVGTLSDAGITPSVNLYATVIACGDGTASKTVDVDYLYVGHTR